MDARRPLNVGMFVTYDLAEDGGVKHHAFALAEALRARGDKVSIVGPATRPQTDPSVKGFRGVVNIHANGSGNALGIFVCPWLIRRHLKAHNFDVIHIHEPLNPTLPYWTAWMTPRIPKVATFHAFRDVDNAALNVARKIWSAPLFPFIHRGIAVSRAAESYARYTWPRSLAIIPNGVNTRVFRPGPAHHEGPLRLLFVGRLSDSRKGFRYMLDAYRLLRARGVDAILDVVGETADTVQVAEPGVTYHGSVRLETLAQHYRSCDIFIAPSTGGESFGMVLLEAMASTRPVICSDIEGYRQVVDEVGAQMVPPRDVEALADAIAALGADPALRRRMGLWNRRRAEAYDWNYIALRVREEYLAAIAEMNGERYYPVEFELPHVPSPLTIMPAKPGLAVEEPEHSNEQAEDAEPRTLAGA